MTIRDISKGHEYMITHWRSDRERGCYTITNMYTIKSIWPWWVCVEDEYGKISFIRRGTVEGIWEVK